MAKHKRLTDSEKHSHELVERLIKWFNAEIKSGRIGKEALLVEVGSEMHINARTIRNWHGRSNYPRSLPLVVALENWLIGKDA